METRRQQHSLIGTAKGRRIVSIKTPRRQRGLTIIGFLFVAAVVLAAVMLGFRVLPAYVEYYAVEKALKRALDDTANTTALDIRKTVERQLNTDYVESVSASDVEVTRTQNGVVAKAVWQRKLPLVANASLLLDFEASASR
jgi:Tfp pilus assembly protein PilE